MSYQIGIDTIHLRPTPRIAHTEYSDHELLARHVAGQDARAFTSLVDAWRYDLLWVTHDGPRADWASFGRSTDMGHAGYMENDSDFRMDTPSPFNSPEEVWAFDAVKEYGLTPMDELVRFYENVHHNGKTSFPECVMPGGYYKTMVSGAIQAFGWENLLEAASDEDRFERVLDSIFQLTLHHVKAWAKTGIEVFIQHDDMVWSAGPFMNPAFYRRVIFPRYARLWRVLHDAGKKVLFCSDGDFSMFVDDIAQAGADGFIFEPMMALDPIVEKYGKTHVIVGSKVDCRTMTFENKAAIQKQIDDTLALARKCPGFIFAVGNHIPGNVPLDNALFYYDYLSRHWQR